MPRNYSNNRWPLGKQVGGGLSEGYWKIRTALRKQDVTGNPGRHWEAQTTNSHYMEVKKPVANQEGIGKFVGRLGIRKPLERLEGTGTPGNHWDNIRTQEINGKGYWETSKALGS